MTAMQVRDLIEARVKSTPILFSAPMIRALLNGSKTQTRRIVKGVNPEEYSVIFGTDCIDSGFFVTFADAPYPEVISRMAAKCPYGVPGDRLWVRETWRNQDGITMLDCNKDEIEYRADGDRPKEPTDCHWKPSIFMPRWASRITLKLSDVRVERLRDISEEDCYAEGCGHLPGLSGKEIYRDIWETINGTGSWALNPWVWVLSFKRL